MTSEPEKRPGTRAAPRAGTQYEDDLRELFERLLQGARSGSAAEDTEEDEEEAPAGGRTRETAEEKTGKPESAQRTKEKDQDGTEDGAGGDDEDSGGEDSGDEAPGDEPAGDTAKPKKKRTRARAAMAGLRRRRAPVLAVLVAVAVGTSAFFAGRLIGEDEDVPRRQVAVRAGEIANTLYNYDYRQVDRYLDRQSAVMTKELAEEAGESRDTISAIITGGKLVWTSRVTRVYVADVSDTSASAIVELNGKVTNSRGISNLTGTVVRFELAWERERWLVSKAPETLTVGDETATDLEGEPLPSESPAPAPEESP